MIDTNETSSSSGKAPFELKVIPVHLKDSNQSLKRRLDPTVKRLLFINFILFVISLSVGCSAKEVQLESKSKHSFKTKLNISIQHLTQNQHQE